MRFLGKIGNFILIVSGCSEKADDNLQRCNIISLIRKRKRSDDRSWLLSTDFYDTGRNCQCCCLCKRGRSKEETHTQEEASTSNKSKGKKTKRESHDSIIQSL